jgi:16S rRNA processing protein RimM
LLGTIEDVNDDTENTLFIIETPTGDSILVPVAMEFISDIDSDKNIVKLDLPEGLSDL